MKRERYFEYILLALCAERGNEVKIADPYKNAGGKEHEAVRGCQVA